MESFMDRNESNQLKINFVSSKKNYEWQISRNFGIFMLNYAMHI